MAFVFALLAAAALGTASVLQQRAAAAAGEGVRGLRLLARMLRSRRWLAGRAADCAALVFQTIALAHGSLILVQAVLSTGLIFAFGLAAATGGRHPRRREWLGAVAVAGGLALFLWFGAPHAGRTSGTPARWAGTLAVATLTVVTARAATRNGSPELAGGFLGAAAGIAFAFDGGLLKSAAASSSAGEFLTRPALYGFLVAAGLGNLLVLESFRAAPLTVTLPALTVAQPLGAIAIGMAVFGERLNATGMAPGMELLGLGAMIVGLTALSPVHEPPAARRVPVSRGPRRGPLPAR